MITVRELIQELSAQDPMKGVVFHVPGVEGEAVEIGSVVDGADVPDADTDLVYIFMPGASPSGE